MGERKGVLRGLKGTKCNGGTEKQNTKRSNKKRMGAKLHENKRNQSHCCYTRTHLGQEADLGRHHRVLLREEELKFEDASCIVGSYRMEWS